MTTMSMTMTQLAAARDVPLGVSGGLTVSQERVDRFADATGDHAWMHVDVERAAASSFGGTIAHGFLGLGLMPLLLLDLLEVSDSAFGLNYGVESVRFPSPLLVGSSVRLQATLVSGELRPQGVLARIAGTLVVDGAVKPAVSAQMLALFMRHTEEG
ncbi:MaoC/PaaZ C-terminal domain-containing protein [Microbacterium sp. SORGH_AS_0888]|uniref:MaoC/PaaZ C-terminal domain-containing protein n=1 Tax=Microbacterium sp. SORGH_AS_0888 TaxID=3041791 RepID=UPI0027D8BBF8|nr:MaoC/PaaZ C-terminal domain-containing protein [Microbacterium sp. SORGH_AS_0888]